MDLRVLGPVQLWAGTPARPLELGPARQRSVLAVLLLEPGHAVPPATLIDRVWGEASPPSVRNVLYSYITRLRQVLAQLPADAGHRAGLVRQAGGYLLDVDPDGIDVHRFRRLVAQAREPGRDDDQRATLLREGLDLWRGEPLAGLAGDWLAWAREGLRQRRLTALTDWADVLLRMGRAAEVADELHEPLGEHPFAEPLIARLLQALHQDNRPAEALDLYARTRRRMIEELGTEPGPELRKAHTTLLRSERVRPPAPSAVPRHLPPDIGDFVGRSRELELLRRLLSPDPARGAAPIAAITGVGGVGKSALAVHAAHQVADRFPDGQLYIDLQGATAGLAPMRPEAVLDQALRALGAPTTDGTSLAEATARFRAATATRRLLLVLDNARDTAQVRPLLPASATCAVVVTSRQILTGLQGASHLHLDLLPPDEAVELLGRLAGTERLRDHPDAGAHVAKLCEHLPLALRIAGARLAARPSWPMQTMVDRLTDAHSRLDELQLADIGVRASLAVSYQALHASTDPADRAAAAAFTRIALPDGPHLTLPVAARLLACSEPDADRLLERLVDAQLLGSPAPGRYRMHDLVRLYAREHPNPNETPTDVLARAHRWYAATAWRAFRLLRPGDPRLRALGDRWLAEPGHDFGSDREALAWLETERDNLVAAVVQAATTPHIPAAIPPALAQGLSAFFWIRGHYHDWLHVNEHALACATRASDSAGTAHAHHDLGTAYERLGNYDTAIDHLHNALETFRSIHDRLGEAASLKDLGVLNCRRQQDHDTALAHLTLALHIRSELGDEHGQAICLTCIGIEHRHVGHPQQAIAHHRQALAIFGQLGARRGVAMALTNLGIVYDDLGQHARARSHTQRALDIFESLGDQEGQAEALSNLGASHHRHGQHTWALGFHRRALALFEQLGDPRGQAESLQRISETLQATDQRQQARTYRERATAIWHHLGAPA